jgi:membrane protease YdiL (CAAX protease family)
LYPPFPTGGVPYGWPYLHGQPPVFLSRKAALDRYSKMGGREKRWSSIKWTAKETLLAMAGIFTIYYLVTILATALTRSDYRVISILAYILLMCPLFSGFSFYLARRQDQGVREMGLKNFSRRRDLGWGLVGGFLALIGNSGLLLMVRFIIYLLTGEWIVETQTPVVESPSKWLMVATILSVTVLAPIFEELFFRGMLYPALRNYLGRTSGLLMNAFIFALLHFQPAGMPSLFIVGLILAYLYEETGSLYSSMIAHSINNIVVLLLTILL